MYLQHVWAVVFTSLCTDFPIPQRQPMGAQFEFENSPCSVFRGHHVTRPTRMMSTLVRTSCVCPACLQQSLRGLIASQSIRWWKVTCTPWGGDTSGSRKLLSVLDISKFTWRFFVRGLNSTGLQGKSKDLDKQDPVEVPHPSASRLSNAKEPLACVPSEELRVCPLRRQCVCGGGGEGGRGGGGLIDSERATGCWCLWWRQAVGDAGVKSSV